MVGAIWVTLGGAQISPSTPYMFQILTDINKMIIKLFNCCSFYPDILDSDADPDPDPVTSETVHGIPAYCSEIAHGSNTNGSSLL